MRKIFVLVLTLFSVALLNNCNNGGNEKPKNMEKELLEFISSYVQKVRPLAKDQALASFEASITGKDEDYKKAADLELQLSKVYSNKEDFNKLITFRDSGNISDEILKRELLVLYNTYLPKQTDEKKLEEMINLESMIEQKFSTFRASVKGKQLTDNDVEDVLSNCTNPEELKATWLASKEIGRAVADDIKKIVLLRNEVAKEMGFNNYHEMSLKASDQNPEDVEKIFAELDSLTRGAFVSLKGEIDDYLCKRLKISKDQLMPWHYQNRYFQEAPKIYNVDLDKYYKKDEKFIVSVTGDYFKGIGLDIAGMLTASDLFEKPGKNQHAYCTDIDNMGDVRVLCNVKPNYNWMNTMLHEFGHAVYDKNIDMGLPYSLREPAHTFTTEAIAMFFGRLASNSQWMKENVGISDDEKIKIGEEGSKFLRLEQLVFSRWAQVMYHFEKSMYENPDQDLNKLWWDIVEKYQLIKRPADRNEPDWATKVHIATSPCYYHNYLLGELLASQLSYKVANLVYKSDDIKSLSFSNNAEIGKFLLENVFKPGQKWYWNDMIEKATGEKLTAKYYAKQFVN